MASADENNATDQSSIECSICSDPLLDPRALPCGHSYCGPPRTCLRAVEKLNGLRCAVCNGEFDLETSQLNPLYGIRDFLEQSTSKSKADEKRFGIKCEQHSGNPVLFWCTQCRKQACQKCFDSDHSSHRLMNFRKHLQLDIESSYKALSEQLKHVRNEASNLAGKVEQKETNFKRSVQSYVEDLKMFDTVIDDLAPFMENHNNDVDLKVVKSFHTQKFEASLLEIQKGLKLVKVNNFANFKFATDFSFDREVPIHRNDWSSFLAVIQEAAAFSLANNGIGSHRRHKEIGSVKIPYREILEIQFSLVFEYMEFRSIAMPAIACAHFANICDKVVLSVTIFNKRETTHDVKTSYLGNIVLRSSAKKSEQTVEGELSKGEEKNHSIEFDFTGHISKPLLISLECNFIFE